jgi:hypothetical protein
MKIIKRFWGVGLIVILVSSMLLAAVPAAAADDNTWNENSGPSGNTYVIKAGADVTDFAVYGNGASIYACAGDNYTYKSTNGGAGWSRTQAAAMADMTPQMIAIAPDNESRIAIANTTTGMVKVSVNGGTTFTTISPIVTATSNLTTTLRLRGLTISPTRNGANYVTVCGIDDAGAGKIFYYNLGAVVGQQWTVLSPFSAAIAWENVAAVAYSPNFLSDLTLMAVTANTTGALVKLGAYSFSNGLWNAGDFPNYPVTLTTAAFTTLDRGTLRLDPSFLGGEDTLRNSFLGLTFDAAATAADGLYRVLNTTVKLLQAGNINSVAFDGTTLAAGQTDSTTIYRSLDPMAGNPTVTGTSSLKSPGGASAATALVTVGFVGTNIAAGTCGPNSAFALSRSSGAAFNDVSLIDTALTDANDMAVSADGAKLYWVTDDGGTYTSLWYKATAWERVLSFAGATNYIVRLSPTNPDIVYVAEKAGTRVYFSKDIQARWSTRTCTTTALQDLAVESDTVAYALDANGYMAKSSNEGFIWSSPLVDTKIASAGSSIISPKANVVIVAGTAGKVAYSLDGASTWSAIPGAAPETNMAGTIVIADESFATNNIIYVASNTVGKNIMKWTIGTSTEWSDYYKGGGTSLPATEGVYGMVMKNGTFYALTFDATTNTTTLNQYIPSVNTWTTKAATAQIILANGTQSPNGLYASTGSNKLWAVRQTGSIYYLVDSIAAAPPAISGPADKTLVNVNPVTGAADTVILTWGRVANATTSTYEVAFDSAFSQTAIAATAVGHPTYNAVINNAAIIPGKTYYWRVRASAPLSSPWSEVRSFTVQPMAAPVPAISSPTNGATITNLKPAFSWSPVSSTTKYDFQLSATSDFSTTVFTAQPLTAGTQASADLQVGKLYFWRVRALEPIQGDWSTVANFLVAAPAVVPTAVVVTQAPAITIAIPQPTQYVITVPPPEPTPVVNPAFIYVIIIIGAILVIAVIVLIFRTRRAV